MKTRFILAMVKFLLKGAPGYHIHRDPGRKRAEHKETERICQGVVDGAQERATERLRAAMAELSGKEEGT